jgi:ubiquinone/menaquinone biosynthesis C-methylase UbiE
VLPCSSVAVLQFTATQQHRNTVISFTAAPFFNRSTATLLFFYGITLFSFTWCYFMKLNWGERLAVNNPLRVIQQQFEMNWFRKKSDLKPGSAILEVGCGRGAGAGLIAKEFQPLILQAMDLDLDMIQKAKEYLPDERRKRISFYVGDVSRLPHGNHTLDAIFGWGVLHHVPDWKEALAEIARVLKPGGIYFLEELYPSLYQNFLTKYFLLHPKENRFRSADLKKALQEFHFRLRAYKEIKSVGILGSAIKNQ